MSTTPTTRPLATEAGVFRALLDRLQARRWEAREHEVAEMLACRVAGKACVAEVGLSGLLERELAVAAGRRAIADIDEALARLESGTYGACEQCGTAISLERVSAIPQARSCGRCRQRRDAFWGEATASR